jgi:hypothetical protein
LAEGTAGGAASFDELCAGDTRVLLVPAEQLSPTGLAPAFADHLRRNHGWTQERIGLFDAAFARYWQRSRNLARLCRDWPAPRLRNVAIAHHNDEILQYARILNTGTWTLYACDFDPDLSDPELAAWLFAHGDRMAVTGEVTEAALRNAAWWFDRSEEKIAAFCAAAGRSLRPDAAALQLLAEAIPWLRELAHTTLRPPALAGAHRPIAGSELLVRRDIEQRPADLVHGWARVARAVVAQQQQRWNTPNGDALRALCAWLAEDAPPLVVCARRNRVVWEASHPERLGALRSELRGAGGATVASIHQDLEVVAARTRSLLAALTAPGELAPIDTAMEQSGYVFLHPGSNGIAYDLHEPGIDRLTMPALPFARAMLAARTVHEWAHRAVDSGWVPRSIDDDEWQQRLTRSAEAFAAVVDAAPAAIRRATAADLETRGARELGAGMVLARIVADRMPDWRANLLAQRFLAPVEREAYVRQNVRTLRGVMSPQALWRMLARYLYEAQYLRFSMVGDRLAYLRHGTWFEQDFLDSGLLTEATLAELDVRVGALCAAWTVDERRLVDGNGDCPRTGTVSVARPEQ